MTGKDELLTPSEVAKMLEVSVRTLGKWRYEHRGPVFIRLGYNRVRYRRAEVEQWIQEREVR